MSQQVIKGTKKLSEKIRTRRLELGLTIEEAALKAGIGTKTWCRYEAGESIRKDKAKGICKALGWNILPDVEKENDDTFNLTEYKQHNAWSEYICKEYGKAAAISFVIGSDILFDYIKEELNELSELPKGSHIGQLRMSILKDMLPKQFLMEYNYELLYGLKISVMRLVKVAHNDKKMIAYSVMDELALYLITEAAEFLMETMSMEMEANGIENLNTWKEWIFELLGDMDIVTCLYSNTYLTNDHIYHVSHWQESQFNYE